MQRTISRAAPAQVDRPTTALHWEVWLLRAILAASATTLPAASDALGVYDRVTHWGKLVHGLEGGMMASLAALLLLGYADRVEFGLPRQLAALASVCVGISAGVVWELADFLIDWVGFSDLQKSNTDTM